MFGYTFVNSSENCFGRPASASPARMERRAIRMGSPAWRFVERFHANCVRVLGKFSAAPAKIHSGIGI